MLLYNYLKINLFLNLKIVFIVYEVFKEIQNKSKTKIFYLSFPTFKLCKNSKY